MAHLRYDGRNYKLIGDYEKTRQQIFKALRQNQVYEFTIYLFSTDNDGTIRKRTSQLYFSRGVPFSFNDWDLADEFYEVTDGEPQLVYAKVIDEDFKFHFNLSD